VSPALLKWWSSLLFAFDCFLSRIFTSQQWSSLDLAVVALAVRGIWRRVDRTRMTSR